jgi:hypothetical protein
LVKDDMSLSLESSKVQTTNIKELSMSPKNQNIENKMTSTPVATVFALSISVLI